MLHAHSHTHTVTLAATHLQTAHKEDIAILTEIAMAVKADAV